MTFRSTRPALAALLAASLSFPALAQEGDTSETTLPPSAQGAVETQLGASDVPASVGELMSDLSGDGVAIPTGDIAEETEVEILPLGALESAGEDREAALDNALARARTKLDMLQTQVKGSAALSDALAAEGYDTDRVLGVYRTADQAMTILIDDRA